MFDTDFLRLSRVLAFAIDRVDAMKGKYAAYALKQLEDVSNSTKTDAQHIILQPVCFTLNPLLQKNY